MGRYAEIAMQREIDAEPDEQWEKSDSGILIKKSEPLAKPVTIEIVPALTPEVIKGVKK